MALKPLNRSW